MTSMLRIFGLSGTLAMLIAAAPAMAASQSGGGKTRAAGAVLAVLDFQGEWESEYPTLNGNWVVPTDCRTGTYLAGPNEVAIVSIGGFLATSGQFHDFLFLKAAISHDGGPFAPLSDFVPAVNSLDGTAASVAMTQRIVLDEGVTYAFGAQFTAGFVVNAWSTCHGTVTIVRLEP
jgi:hypothetical protein